MKKEKKPIKLFDVKKYKKVKAGDDYIKLPVLDDDDDNDTENNNGGIFDAIANGLELNIKKNKGESATIHASLDINTKSFFG